MFIGLFIGYLALLIALFFLVRRCFSFWHRPKVIRMVLDEMAITVTPNSSLGYIRLQPNAGVYSVPLKKKGNKIPYMVLDFNNETHELSGIEFLDLKLMPSNWRAKAHIYND